MTGGGNSGGNTGFLTPTNLPQTPVVASRPPPALSGGTLNISPDGKIAVAADPDRDKVYVVDLASRLSRTIQLTRGAEPGRVAFDASGRAHVALRSGGTLAQIDTATATVLRQTPVCEFPRGVAYNAASDAILVACASGDLVTLAAADHVERARAFIELDLRDVVVTKGQQTLVTTFRTAEMIEVDANGKVVRRAFPATGTQERFAFDPLSCQQQAQKFTMLPRIAWRTLLRADGTALMLHQRAQEEEVKVGTPGGYGGGGSCTTVTGTTIDTVALDGSAQAGATITATTAVDFAVSPSEQWVAVASAGAYLNGRGTVQFYPLSTVVNTVPPGSCSGPSQELGSGTQATALAFDPSGRLIVQSREPAQLQIYTLLVDTNGTSTWSTPNSDSPIALDSESVRDTGHDLFHADVGGGIACASCHPEGRDDAHTWTFEGIGARRTQNMRGGLSGSAPFHWDGDMTDFQHLVDVVMTGRMKGFFVEKKYGDALLAWIDRLPALKLAAGKHASTALDKVERGKALFASSECATCHAGAALTISGSVDVGTGGPFQVPSLRGLALRGPFMHDGCAKTLLSRFDEACGGGDRHGKTSHLTQAQREDLTAYLSTL
jgi:DNA-binding beta-propeller fold protein YncE/mono/diheme cytochrome c family protein